MYKNYRRIFSLLGLFITSTLLYYLISKTIFDSSEWINPLELWGTRDLIAFWGGTQQYLKGLNPYDLNGLLIVQHSVLAEQVEPQFFLNPPWSLPIFAIFFGGSFEFTRFLWLVLNLFFLISSSLIIKSWYPHTRITLIQTLLAGTLTVPTIMALWMGQLTLFIFFFLCLSFTALKNRLYFLTGILMVPLTLKPHLLFLVFVLIIIWSLKERKFNLLLGLISGFIILNLIVYLSHPQIYDEFLHSSATPTLFRTSTLTSIIRGWFYNFTGELPFWPLYVIPISASIGLVYNQLYSKRAIQWESDGIKTLILSLIFAPYTWLYDYTLLNVVQVAAFCISKTSLAPLEAFNRCLTVFIVIQLGTILTGFIATELFWYFWYPAVMLGVWYWFSELFTYKKNFVPVH
jgi:hypothetical protein